MFCSCTEQKSTKMLKLLQNANCEPHLGEYVDNGTAVPWTYIFLEFLKFEYFVYFFHFYC